MEFIFNLVRMEITSIAESLVELFKIDTGPDEIKDMFTLETYLEIYQGEQYKEVREIIENKIKKLNREKNLKSLGI